MLGAGFLGGQHLGITGAISLLPLLTLGTAAALVDVRERRLPDQLTGALALVTATAIAIAATVEPAVSVRALIGAAAGLALATLGRICSPDGFGWGDAKLLPSLTAWLASAGLDVLLTGLQACSGLIAVTALVVAAHRGRSVVVPFGPALVIGTVVPITMIGFT
jgi:prepilin signal peptidase PulO-like enzyme (type II secretory pathway)